MTGFPVQVERAFSEAVAETQRGQGFRVELLPGALARAAARVLAVDGASLSVQWSGLRIPLGASDDPSGVAERIQCTVGDGPCLEAITSDMVIDAWRERLESRWPMLFGQWSEATPFRSALSVPVPLGGAAGCALNLYFVSPGGGGHLEPHTLSLVALAVARHLLETDGDEPPWLLTPSARDRQQVWIVLGMLMKRLPGTTFEDALDRLRAEAFANQMTLDALVADVLADPGRIVRLEV